MAGVEEVRAGIAQANEKAQESQGALQQAALCLEEAQQSLQQATSGSSQPEITDAAGLLAQAVDTITQLQGTVNASVQSAEGYAARL